MKSAIIKKYTLAFFISFISATACYAQLEHQSYIHALTDLRAARWLIDQRPQGEQPSDEEKTAMHSIEVAVAVIINADIDDGHYFGQHPEPGVDNIDIAGKEARIERAAELLRKARTDVRHDDDDAFHGGLKAKTIAYIEEAMRSTEKLGPLASR
jgi:hypothetical protein